MKTRISRPPGNYFVATGKITLYRGNSLRIGLSFDNAPSLNREKYSECADVLISAEGNFAAHGYGVLSLRVQDATLTLPDEHPAYLSQRPLTGAPWLLLPF